TLVVFISNDPSSPVISPLSLHDALPISSPICWSSCTNSIRLPVQVQACEFQHETRDSMRGRLPKYAMVQIPRHQICRLEAKEERSEEHTSELQSLAYLVCRLLLEKKKI